MVKRFLLILLLCVSYAVFAGECNIIVYTANAKLAEVEDAMDDGFDVTAFNVDVLSHTFSNDTGIITFADTLTSIMSCAFYNCTGMRTISFPNTVSYIGRYAFCHCKSLQTFTFPTGMATVAESVLYGCTSLTYVRLPDNVETIEMYAFAGDSALSVLHNEYGYLPKTIGNIQTAAFRGCVSLFSVEVPYANIYAVGTNAFKDVTHLIFDPYGNFKDLTLRNKAPWGAKCWNGEAIWPLVYKNWDKKVVIACQFNTTDTVDIHENVKSIGDGAFAGCTQVPAIVCHSTVVPTCSEGCFADVDKNIPVFVRSYLVDDYRTAPGWRDFVHIYPIGFTPTSDVSCWGDTHSVLNNANVSKRLENGRLLIHKNGVQYNSAGVMVK